MPVIQKERETLPFKRGIIFILAILVHVNLVSCQKFMALPGADSPEDRVASEIRKAKRSRIIARQDGHYIQYDSGVVYDQQTGLEWYAGPDRDTTFAEAQNWVGALTVDGGYWRMPTGPELEALYQKGGGKANMTPLLTMSGMWVWAGETNEASAWTFNYEYGYGHWDFQSNAGFFRAFAVRKH